MGGSDGNRPENPLNENVPVCADDSKPYIGQKFRTLKDAEDFYRSYGAVCGFDIRLGQSKKSSHGLVIQRYIYCNREGLRSDYTRDEKVVSYTKRRRLSSRVACMARVILCYCAPDGYVIDVFNETHTHSFVLQPYRHFMKCNRNLDYMHQNFILNCAKSNIGPMKSFRLFKEIIGRYRNIGCSSTEFVNFSRYLKAYVEGVDAQILLDKFRSRREIKLDFTYDYCVNESEKLSRIFWADLKSIKMYRAFGDAVSFDATCSTNKYNMIFTPFTGKENHGRCVTFGAGLISKEDIESYVWVLQRFVDCMKSRPNMIITDQDPAIKIVVERVMPDTKHRFCMWHIMVKVADKIPVSLSVNEGFIQKFNDVVRSESIGPDEFDTRWKAVLGEFGLLDHEWLAAMFELRELWIPAYFKDVPMSGLFRTTLMSESENSFFRRYNNRNANFLTFMMHFESTIDAQRDGHNKLSGIHESSIPKLRHDYLFEGHAAAVYTTQIFLRVQKDIRWAGNKCSIANIDRGPVVIIYDIEDSYLNQVYKVELNDAKQTVVCECNHFGKRGLLCRHIYMVFNNSHFRRIPDRYIFPRWTRYPCSKELLCSVGQDNVNQIEKIHLFNILHMSATKCIGYAEGDVQKLNEMVQDFNHLLDKYKPDGIKEGDFPSKQMGFESFYGSAIPEDVDVLPSDQVKTKGSGSRLKSRKEKAIRDANKPKRKCSKCKQMGNHDARNCHKVE